jgi:hypothetical protein
LTGESRDFSRSKTTTLDTPVKPEYDDKGKNHLAGSGLRPEPIVSDRQEVEGPGTAVHGQGFSDTEASGADYKFGKSRSRPAPAKEVQNIPLSIEGLIRHTTGVPAENIRVQVDIGGEGESVLCLDEITDREGRFALETGEFIRPPGNIVIRGELFNRVMRGPLRDAQVNMTIRAGGGERTFSAITDFRGRFSAGEGVRKKRRRRDPLWTPVERDHRDGGGPQFYEWDMGWE